MLPENLVLDEVRSPKTVVELEDLLEGMFRVEYEATTLEALALQRDGTVRTPSGELRLTRKFLEESASLIGMPEGYAYKISAELFRENFAQRCKEAAVAVTVCRVGDTATGLVCDRKSRYRAARTLDVLRKIRPTLDLEFRRATVSFYGVDIELVRPGAVVEPEVGDVIEIGMAITNSESGGRQMKGSAYAYRLGCSNGAIMSDLVGVARWPNDPRMTDAGCLRALHNDLTQLGSKLDVVSTLYKAAMQRPIPVGAFWNLRRRVAYVLSPRRADAILGVTDDSREELQQRIRLNDPREVHMPTGWNVYETHNRITHAAHGEGFQVRRGLQEIGGELLSRATEWPPGVSNN